MDVGFCRCNKLHRSVTNESFSTASGRPSLEVRFTFVGNPYRSLKEIIRFVRARKWNAGAVSKRQHLV